MVLYPICLKPALGLLEYGHVISATYQFDMYFLIIKTHVRGFFDTDLHEVSRLFGNHWVLSSTDRAKTNVEEAIQNGVLFLSHT